MGFPAGSGPAVARMGGRGVTPTPPLFFFLSGGYPPPICRANRGVPPSPSGPWPGDPPKSKKNRRPHPSRRRFHAKYRIRPCRKGARCPHGGEGGGHHPPLPSFWKILVMAGTSGFLEG